MRVSCRFGFVALFSLLMWNAQASAAEVEPSRELRESATASDGEGTDDGPSADVAGAGDIPAGAPPPPNADIEEILIRGEVRAATDVDVPTSAVEFDAETLQVERIQNIGDLSAFTPNLQINTAFAASNPVIFIRGVGLDDFNANSGSSVAIYQDGIYMNSPAGQLFQFFDVQSATVLRGPYGGPYRNAGAGVILIDSVRPKHEFEANAQLSYGNYNLAEVQGAINIPLVEDILASRTSMTMQRRDGYTTNRCYGQEITPPNVANPYCTRPSFPGFNIGYPADIHSHVNNADNFAVRTQLLLDVPLEDSTMEWLLNIHGGQNRGQATQYQQRGVRRKTRDSGLLPGVDTSGYWDTDGDFFAGDYNAGGDELLDLLGGSLKGTWDFSDRHTLTSLSGYEWHDRDTLENTDANPRALLVVNYADRAWQFSQDLRLESDWTYNLSTSVGAYFIMEDLRADNTIDQQARSAKVLTMGFDQLTRSYSFYGSLSWAIFERLSFEGDLRYSREFKKFSIESAMFRQIPPDCRTDLGGVVVPFNEVMACRNGVNSATESKWFSGSAGNAALSYDLMGDETKTAYFKYSRGWKPGHFNGGAFTSRELIDPVKPETVNAYEAGLKSVWLDGLFALDAAVFYYDFENMQVFQLESDIGVGPIAQLINAQGAEIFGVEFDLYAAPFDGMEIRLNAAYLDTEYSEFRTTIAEPIPQMPDEPPPPEFLIMDVVYSGNRMLASPKWSMAGSIQQTILVGKFGELTPRFSFAFKDDVFFDVAEGRGIRNTVEKPALPYGTIGQKAYWLVNASLAWRPENQNLELRLWARNLAQQAYRVQSFDLTDPTFRSIIDAYGPPRTFGATLSLWF